MTSEAIMPKISSIRPAVLIEVSLVTDSYGATANTMLAQCRAVKSRQDAVFKIHRDDSVGRQFAEAAVLPVVDVLARPVVTQQFVVRETDERTDRRCVLVMCMTVRLPKM